VLHLTPAPTSSDMLLLFKRDLKPVIRARIESLLGDFLPKSFHGYAEFADKQERELKANRHAISFRKDSEKILKRSPVRSLKIRLTSRSSRPNSPQTTAPLSRKARKKKQSSRTSAANRSNCCSRLHSGKLGIDYIGIMHLHCKSAMSCHIGDC
jgi:hypothetical protein